jgi:hypothetical protein
MFRFGSLLVCQSRSGNSACTNLSKTLVSTVIALQARDATTAHKSTDGRQKVNHAQVVCYQATPIDIQKLSFTGIDVLYLHSLCLSPEDRCTSAAITAPQQLSAPIPAHRSDGEYARDKKGSKTSSAKWRAGAEHQRGKPCRFQECKAGASCRCARIARGGATC